MLLILKSKKTNSYKTEKTIKKLLKRLRKKDVPTTVASFYDVELFIEKSKIKISVKGRPLTSWSTIYFRNVGKFEVLAYIIAQLAIKNKIKFLDQAYGNTGNQGKLKQTFQLAFRGLPVPKTYYSPSYDKKKIKKASTFLGWPIVVKITHMDRGRGVSLAKNDRELAIILEKIPNEQAILQKYLVNDLDYRVLVLGHKARVAEKRIRTDPQEFRNNISLGAREEFIKISEIPQKAITDSERASTVTDIQVAGVDFIIDPEGQHYFLEINTMPAFTHDERISSEIKKLAQYLFLCEKK